MTPWCHGQVPHWVADWRAKYEIPEPPPKRDWTGIQVIALWVLSWVLVMAIGLLIISVFP